MRRLFFLALGMLLAAAGIGIAAAMLAPEPEAAGDETVITVLCGGELTETTLAEYLPGVVAAEMPASFEPEALKAQAVAARTYILDRAAHPVDAHPDAAVCGDPGCCCAWIPEEAMRENWGRDFRRNRAKIRAAVRETAGQRLTYEGVPIRAVFHSASAGQTESSEALWGPLPYLVSVDSPETAADVPNYETEVRLTPEALRAAVASAYPELVLPEDPAAWLGGISTDASGRTAYLTIGGQAIPGAEARALFSLRSTAFTVDYALGEFVFTVRGSGHGVGMSQYGANVMAKGGADYVQILAHYYPGTVLE